MASTKKSAFRSEQMAQVMDEARFRMRQAKRPEASEIPKEYGGTARQFNHPLEKGNTRQSLRRSAQMDAQQTHQAQEDLSVRRPRASINSPKAPQGTPQRETARPVNQATRATRGKLIDNLVAQQRQRASSAPDRQLLMQSAGAGGRRRRRSKFVQGRRRRQTPPTRRQDGPNVADYLSPLRAA